MTQSLRVIYRVRRHCSYELVGDGFRNLHDPVWRSRDTGRGRWSSGVYFDVSPDSETVPVSRLVCSLTNVTQLSAHVAVKNILANELLERDNTCNASP